VGRWRKYFLYVGNFKPHKNVELLVAAFQEGARLADGCRSMICLLVGGDAGRGAAHKRELIGRRRGRGADSFARGFPG
jgi:glycosyltransferase involved in cell wall biosynthesis